jgi:hypothetical protein
MPTHVYFSGRPSIIVEEDFDQVQQQLEHEAASSRLGRMLSPAIESASAGQPCVHRGDSDGRARRVPAEGHCRCETSRCFD